MDMLDYIKWRGDLTFDERELNEIDSLIFTTLSYEEFDGILSPNLKLTLNQVADAFFKKHKEEDLAKRKTFTYRSYEILKACRYTKRYGNILLSNYINQTNTNQNLQFSAITFQYQNKWKYIAFRGTDETIIGWKEDFMLLYQDEISSQKKAAEYLQTTLKQHKPFSKMNYYIGGHSKGGNLAIWACSAVPKKMHKHIIAIHNFDGPGFDVHFWNQPSINSLLSKITTFIPSASFFGRLFKHNERIVILKSDSRGLLQHSAFYWHVDVQRFAYELDVSDGSDKAISRFNDLMNSYTKKERETLVEALFSILANLDIHTIEDFTKVSFTKVINSLKELNDLDNDAKKALREMLTMIWDISNI